MLTVKLTNISDIENLPVKIDYVGETIQENNSQCDQWRITISSKMGFNHFDYFTGLGLRSKNRPKRPRIADVLYSLILDASAADYNFSDWCADYGYSDDSIKALNTYKSCLETAQVLLKHFSPLTLRTLREMLQDY